MPMYDVLIKNARVVDGAGNPWFLADVAIAGDRIVRVSRGLAGEARLVLDASGLILCPGFIDSHTHSDLRILKHPEDEAKIMQGVTSALLGQDGLSVAPVGDETLDLMKRRVSGLLGTYVTSWTWRTTAEYLTAVEAVEPATNVLMMVPHSSVRAEVVGWENRPAEPHEIDRMKALVSRSMEEGAIAFSTGLIYPPGMYAGPTEMVELLKTAGKYGGFFVVHMRNESDHVMESVREVAGYAKESGVPLHISHLKVGGRRNWGRAVELLCLIDEYRASGLDVTFDQYPYVAGSTMLDATVPPWVHEGGVGKMLLRLQDPKVRDDIRKDQAGTSGLVWENWPESCGFDRIVVTAVRSEKNRFAEGKTILDISSALGRDPTDVICDLLIEEDDAVTMAIFYGDEQDMRTIMRHSAMIVCSDGIVGGKPHPRVYGTCPRVLGRYVREEKVLTLEEAVRKMTSAPAQRLGLKDRGLIREGQFADIAAFDPATIADTATFAEPNQFPVGVKFVLVNGVLTMKDGALTGARAGKVLRR